MARPRRARNRPGRVLLPLVLLIAVGAVLVGWRTNFTYDVAGLMPPRASTATDSPSPRPSTQASPTVDSSERTSRAMKVLRSCQSEVKAADAVIDAADTGIGHWSDHVKAQTKANRDQITVTMLDKVFDKTRDAGPKDQKRYREARKDHGATEGSCQPVQAAPKDVAADLTSCRKRAEAQKRVMDAAQPAMEDWKTHLEQMNHSAKHPQPDDQAVWLKAWRAAPPNINAYTKAMKEFEDDASRCQDRR